MAARARNILVGYDGSEAAQRALDAAADLVGYGSALSVVTVATRPEDEPGDNGGPAAHDRARELLGDARARCSSAVRSRRVTSSRSATPRRC